MTAREKIFSALSAALDPLPERARRPEVPHGVADAKWMASCPDVISLFSERLQEAGTACFESPEDLAAWMASRRPKQIFVPPEYDDLAATLSVAGGVTREYRRDRVNEIDATLTVAAGGIAESGSIVLTDKTFPDRLAALAPWIHVALVRRETVYRSIADALDALPDDPNIIWVTGPSKTADVEGILIQGVHGPGVQACLIC